MVGMKREDFMFTIGYDGNTALVNKELVQKYKKTGITQLLDDGLYKPAFAAALYDESEEEMDEVMQFLNKQFGTQYERSELLKRLFGVFAISQEDISSSYL